MMLVVVLAFGLMDLRRPIIGGRRLNVVGLWIRAGIIAPECRINRPGTVAIGRRSSAPVIVALPRRLGPITARSRRGAPEGGGRRLRLLLKFGHGFGRDLWFRFLFRLGLRLIVGAVRSRLPLSQDRRQRGPVIGRLVPLLGTALPIRRSLMFAAVHVGRRRIRVVLE